MQLKEDFDYFHFPRDESILHHVGLQVKHQVLVRRQKQEQGGKKGKSEQDKQFKID